MSNTNNTGPQSKQPQPSVRDYGEVRCLICGRPIEDQEEVLPLVAIEQGRGIGYQVVVCESCIHAFDSRVIHEVLVTGSPVPDRGIVM